MEVYWDLLDFVLSDLIDVPSTSSGKFYTNHGKDNSYDVQVLYTQTHFTYCPPVLSGVGIHNEIWGASPGVKIRTGA